MKKMITLVVFVALVVAMTVPVTAFAVSSDGQSRTQTSYSGDNLEPPGNGDMDCLQTRDRLYEQDCLSDCDCDGEQTRTQTQTQEMTRTQAQEMNEDPAGAQVKAQVKAGALGEEGDAPEETPVAATVRAETQAGEGFFGGIAAGLQRFALRFMAWLGLL